MACPGRAVHKRHPVRTPGAHTRCAHPVRTPGAHTLRSARTRLRRMPLFRRWGNPPARAGFCASFAAGVAAGPMRGRGPGAGRERLT